MSKKFLDEIHIVILFDAAAEKMLNLIMTDRRQ